MAKSKMQFWFEFASPYTFLAAMRIRKLAAEKNVSIEWRPFLLGPVFKHHGMPQIPFKLYPTKGQYMWVELERFSKKYNLTYHKPTDFPRNGLLAARIAHCIQDEPYCPDFMEAVYEANFVQDHDIYDEGLLGDLLEKLHLPKDEILEQAFSEENKNSLKAQTQHAIEKGIFGAPSFIIGNELYFGQDRLEDALDYAVEMGANLAA